MSSPDNSSILELLIALTRDIRAAADTEQLLQRLIAAASELTNSEAASILKFDGKSNTLRFIASSFLNQDSLKVEIVPLDESIAGWTFRKNKYFIIQDVANNSRHFKEVDLALISNFTMNSLLAIPIAHRGNMIGVLEVVNKRHNAHYTEDDVTILEMLALYVSMTLWNSDLEELIQVTRDEYAELDRLKSNFIAITSHELRTPLGLILGHATFLKEMIAEEHHEQVDTIIQNSTRLKEIIQSLTDIKNFETDVARVRRELLSIPHLIEKVILTFQDMAARKNITLKSDISDEGLQLEGDDNKITVAISNLVGNAIAFTDEGGQVLVTAEAVNENIQISVKDNGIGITPSDQAQVFDRFFQVESHLTRRHSGMGLGLTVAKTMVELHGGRIWVESVENQGSTFTLLLPLKPAYKNPAEQAFNS